MFRCWRKRQQRRYSVKNGSNTTDEDCISFHIWCIILSFFNIQWTTKIKWKSKILCALCAWNRTHFYIVITQILYIYDLMHFFIDQLVKFFLLIGQSNVSEAFVAPSGPHPTIYEKVRNWSITVDYSSHIRLCVD